MWVQKRRVFTEGRQCGIFRLRVSKDIEGQSWSDRSHFEVVSSIFWRNVRVLGLEDNSRVCVGKRRQKNLGIVRKIRV